MHRKEIAPGIIVEQRYPPFNVGIICGEEGAIVVNAPPLPEDSYAWRRQAQVIGGRIRYLVVTNADPLHLIGALILQVPLILSSAAAERLRTLDEKSWDLFRLEVEEAMRDFGIEALSLLPLPPRPPLLVHGAEVKLHLRYGGAPRQLLLTPIPEMPSGALWAWVEKERVLFTGDGVLVGEVPLIARGTDREAWLRRLRKLQQDRSVRWIVPGRGDAPIPPARLEEMEELWAMMARSAEELATRPRGEGVGQAAQTLRQAFFPHVGKNSATARRLHDSLDNWAADLRGDPEEVEEEAS